MSKYNSLLKESILKNDIEKAKLAINEGADVNDGALIIDAVRSSTPEMVKLIAQSGANLEVVGGFQDSTALWYAVDEQKIDAVRILIEAGANVDVAGFLGETPLISASVGGNIELTKLLLEAGANIHMTDCYNGAALTYARENSIIYKFIESHEPKEEAKEIIDAACKFMFGNKYENSEALVNIVEKIGTVEPLEYIYGVKKDIDFFPIGARVSKEICEGEKTLSEYIEQNDNLISILREAEEAAESAGGFYTKSQINCTIVNPEFVYNPDAPVEENHKVGLVGEMYN